MSSSTGLEAFYSGDEAWRNFASNGLDEWKSCKFKDELIASVGGDVEIAMVIYHFQGEDYRTWLEGQVPALEYLTPLECLNTSWGVKRLKECLMRME